MLNINCSATSFGFHYLRKKFQKQTPLGQLEDICEVEICSLGIPHLNSISFRTTITLTDTFLLEETTFLKSFFWEKRSWKCSFSHSYQRNCSLLHCKQTWGKLLTSNSIENDKTLLLCGCRQKTFFLACFWKRILKIILIMLFRNLSIRSFSFGT